MQSFLVAFERVGPIFQVPTLAVTAGLAVFAAVGTLAGLRIRFRRGLPQTPVQRIAAWLQGSTALAWIVSAAAAGAFAAAVANDAATAVFVNWPHPSLLVFSMAALVATALALDCRPAPAGGLARSQGNTRMDVGPQSFASRSRRRRLRLWVDSWRCGARCSRGTRNDGVRARLEYALAADGRSGEAIRVGSLVEALAARPCRRHFHVGRAAVRHGPGAAARPCRDRPRRYWQVTGAAAGGAPCSPSSPRSPSV